MRTWPAWRWEIRQAREQHAFLLRNEGLTFREIGERLGVGRQRAFQMVFAFERRMRALRDVRLEILGDLRP